MQWIKNRFSNLGTIGNKIGWVGSKEYAGFEPDKGVSFTATSNSTTVPRYNKSYTYNNEQRFKAIEKRRMMYESVFKGNKYSRGGVELIARIVKQAQGRDDEEIVNEVIEDMKSKNSSFASLFDEAYERYRGGSRRRRTDTRKKKNRKNRKTRR